MRRFIAKLVLFLVLGAIINIAVAWTWWLWPAPVELDYVPSTDAIATWSDWAPADWVHFNDIWIQMNGVCVTWDAGFRQTGQVVGNDTPAVSVYSEGWPYRSMQGSEIRQRWEMDSLVSGDRHFIATKPLWPGFAINTIFYAGILWLPFAALGTIRRRRTKRGLCPKCGYDLRGQGSDSNACPECGRVKT